MRHKLISNGTGNAVNVGDRIMTFRGETGTLMGFQAPLTPQSTGRVTVSLDGFEQNFYPSVIDCKIVADE
jgi:hypothetical protein